MLARVPPRAALVCPSPVSRSLVARGLMAAEPDGSFAHITPAGLRALADAADRGEVQLFTMPERKDDRT